jgi:hypothetical protein
MEIAGLWSPKWPLSKSDPVSTAGSCFAQHIGRALSKAGYSWFDAEPAPAILPEDIRRNFNYGIFSFRTGNIYTVALLLQWLNWALGRLSPPNEVWEADGRFYDPFRPAIEPNGFASKSELSASRQATLEAIKRSVTESSVFVFTLGLTEAWLNRGEGYVYPMCPGTVAGCFNANLHEFHNYRYSEIRRDLEAAIALMKSVNRSIKLLLTVSPVPLTATAANKHVLVATTQSKSTLRAVAGDLADARDDVDYFPSFEIISSFPFRGMFYEKNMRSVAVAGVEFVMTSFFAGMKVSNSAAAQGTSQAESVRQVDPARDEEDVICEDIALEAFVGA